MLYYNGQKRKRASREAVSRIGVPRPTIVRSPTNVMLNCVTNSILIEFGNAPMRTGLLVCWSNVETPINSIDVLNSMQDTSIVCRRPGAGGDADLVSVDVSSHRGEQYSGRRPAPA